MSAERERNVEREKAHSVCWLTGMSRHFYDFARSLNVTAIQCHRWVSVLLFCFVCSLSGSSCRACLFARPSYTQAFLHPLFLSVSVCLSVCQTTNAQNRSRAPPGVCRATCWTWLVRLFLSSGPSGVRVRVGVLVCVCACLCVCVFVCVLNFLSVVNSH
jgi:hypothetical protein